MGFTRADLLAYLVGLARGVAGGEGEVNQIQQLKVHTSRNVPRLGLGFLDGTGDWKWLIVVVGNGPGAGGTVEIGALNINGLAGIARIGAALANRGGVCWAQVALRQCIGGWGSEYAGGNG